jgi:hypothetical protein
VTYEPKTGVIEVVAGDRASRENIVRIFAKEILTIGTEQKRLPFRKYDLAILLKPHAFPSDSMDGIDTVRVTQLRLMPVDTAGERVVLECSRQSPQTIWEMAEQHFGPQNPLCRGWIVTQAKLAIRFHPETGSQRGKMLPLTITMPHGCDLKDRTEREQLIGQKYLTRWQLLKHV